MVRGLSKKIVCSCHSTRGEETTDREKGLHFHVLEKRNGLYNLAPSRGRVERRKSESPQKKHKRGKRMSRGVSTNKLPREWV